MPELPFIQSSYSEVAGSVPASTQGTTINSSASPNVKGSYTELVAATTRDAQWILIHCTNHQTGAAFLSDIAIGAATEQILIPNLFSYRQANGTDFAAYLFPVFIPAGTRIAARTQCSSGSSALDISINLFGGTALSGGSGPSIVSTYGAVTATSFVTAVDPGGSANTDGSWVQITAATDRQHNWMCISGRWGDGNIGVATRYFLDIGVGSATEAEIISDICSGSEPSADHSFKGAMCFPYTIPAGTRIAARARSSVTTAGDRQPNIMIYGV